MREWVVYISLAVMGGLWWASPSMAQTVGQPVPNNAIEQILDQYRDHAQAWEGALRQAALGLFWLLAGIQWAWSAVRLVLKGADFSEWVAEIVQQICVIGFFLTALLHSSEWAGAIVQSFRSAANAASAAAGGSTQITPSNFFDVAIEIITALWANFSLVNLADSILLSLAALVILVCLALVGAYLVVALVESYIVVSAGVLMMGFGGARWTSDLAVQTLKYAVSVGAKLFILQLLVGLGEQIILDWSRTFQTETAQLTDVLVIAGACIVFATLTKAIPDLVQSLVTGSALGGFQPLQVTTTQLAQGASQATAQTLGAGAAVYQAAQLAQVQHGGLEAGGGPLGRLAQMTGHTALNLGKAGLDDLGRRLSGRAPHGTPTGRMAYDLQEQVKDARHQQRKPPAPEPPSNRIEVAERSHPHAGG